MGLMLIVKGDEGVNQESTVSAREFFYVCTVYVPTDGEYTDLEFLKSLWGLGTEEE